MDEHEHGLARTKDPDTSHAAARGVDATKLQGMVLYAMREWGSMTASEISERLEISLQSITPRMRPLAEKGLIRDSGERRMTPRGRKSIVWEIVPGCGDPWPHAEEDAPLSFEEVNRKFGL